MARSLEAADEVDVGGLWTPEAVGGLKAGNDVGGLKEFDGILVLPVLVTGFGAPPGYGAIYESSRPDVRTSPEKLQGS